MLLEFSVVPVVNDGVWRALERSGFGSVFPLPNS